VLIAKTWEALAVSLVALGGGLLAAYVHVYMAGAALFAPVLRGWAVLAPRLHLAPTLDVPLLAAIVAATLALPASGVLLACRRAASAEPDAAMRE
jgi:hypothetical protein